MSLVGVHKDYLEKERLITLEQERRIDHSSHLKKWQLSDATSVLFLEKIIGLLFLPVAIFWGFITLSISLGVGMTLLVFRGLNSLYKKPD